MDTRWKIFSIVALTIALGLLVAPKVVPFCSELVATASGGQVPMRCYYTFRAQSLFAVASVVTAALLFVVRGVGARKAVGAVLVVLAIMMLLLPVSGVMGVCRHGEAPCRDTAFWNNVLSTGQVLVGLVLLFLKAPVSPSSPVIKEVPPSTGEKIKWLD